MWHVGTRDVLLLQYLQPPNEKYVVFFHQLKLYSDTLREYYGIILTVSRETRAYKYILYTYNKIIMQCPSAVRPFLYRTIQHNNIIYIVIYPPYIALPLNYKTYIHQVHLPTYLLLLYVHEMRKNARFVPYRQQFRIH